MGRNVALLFYYEDYDAERIEYGFKFVGCFSVFSSFYSSPESRNQFFLLTRF